MHSVNDKIKIYGGSSSEELKILKEGTYSNLKWLLYENETSKTRIGYYFPQEKDITIKQSIITKNQKEVRNVANQKDNIITKGYTTITYEHNNKTYDNYAYVIVPNATIDEIQKYVNSDDVKLIENSKNIHIVEDTKNKIKAYNFFEKDKSKNIEASSPVSIIIKQENDIYKLAVSDPLFSQSEIEFTMIGNFSLLEENELVKVIPTGNKTKITLNTDKIYGKTINFTLKK